MIIMDKKRKMPALLSIMGEEHKSEGGEISSDAELHQCAHELVEAVHARSVPDVVAAFKAMFNCCESEPHEEYGEG